MPKPLVNLAIISDLTPIHPSSKGSERPRRSLRFDPHYLDIDRDNGFLLITLSAGRTTDAKQAFCRLAWRLRTRRIASQAGWSERAVTKTVEPYAHAVDERRLDEIDAAF